MRVILGSLYLLLLTLNSNGNVELESRIGPDWKLQIRVVDSKGVPVANARVSSAYPLLGVPAGEITRPGESTELSDEDGFAELSGKRTRRDINIYVSKEGYYDSKHNYFFDRKRLTRWMPWNPTVEVLLREKRNPVPMYAKNFSSYIPEEDKPIGFDFEVGDWVSPYGKGRRSDFILFAQRRYESIQDFEVKYRIEFPNEGDGVLEYRHEYPAVSSLLMPYKAPENGYESLLIREMYRTPSRGEATWLRDMERSFIFRVRTVKDSSGNIIEAHYGKIHSDIKVSGLRGDKTMSLSFQYHFNPDKTRNLESDLSKNLFPSNERGEITEGPYPLKP